MMRRRATLAAKLSLLPAAPRAAAEWSHMARMTPT